MRKENKKLVWYEIVKNGVKINKINKTKDKRQRQNIKKKD